MNKHLIIWWSEWSGFYLAFILSETGFYFWKLKSFMRKLKKQSYIFLRIVVFHNSLLPILFSTVIKAIFSKNLIHWDLKVHCTFIGKRTLANRVFAYLAYSKSRILQFAVLHFNLTSVLTNTSFQFSEYVKQSWRLKCTYTLQQSVIQILRATMLYVSGSLSYEFETCYCF